MNEPPRDTWMALIGVLSCVAAALASRVITGIPDILPLAGGVFLALIVFLASRVSGKSAKTTTIRVMSLALGGAWSSCAARIGLSPLLVAILLLVAGAMLLVSMEARASEATQEAESVRTSAELAAATNPVRDPQEAAIECLLRRITKQRISVTKVVPWEDPDNGMDVHVDLPENFTAQMLADHANKIQSSPTLRLPQGCLVAVLDGEYQCEAILSIMRRDCLKDYIALQESVEPASINDEFDLIRAPQGHWFKITLRIACMVIGGTTGSGKTTLLNRIIAYLARCTDALIWIVDFNGGGLGATWTRLYEEGAVDRPTVDWLADNETEAAVLLACAHGIAASRKTDKEAVSLRRAAGANILPVGPNKPAIIVITDEGGEVRQAASVLGQIVCRRISRLAQIGRAEAVRVIMSVLRGTSDLLDKALRAFCAIRVCLRMDEEGEVDHILGKNPGRTHLLHTGSAWLYRTTQDPRPTIGRSVNVTPQMIEDHSRATAHLRPTLDQAGQRICQTITLTDIFDGIDPENFPELLDRPALVDVAAGAAYTNRWERRKARLAAMERGEDPDSTSTGTSTTSATRTATTTETSRLSTLVAKLKKPAPQQAPEVEETQDATWGDDQAETPTVRLDAQEDTPQASTRTLREHLGIILAEHPTGLRAGQIEKVLTDQGVSYSRKNLFDQLGRMVDRGDARKHGDQYLPSGR